MTFPTARPFRLPPRIAQPISWSAKPGWFGLTRYTAKFTDGQWRRVSLAQIIDAAGYL